MSERPVSLSDIGEHLPILDQQEGGKRNDHGDTTQVQPMAGTSVSESTSIPRKEFMEPEEDFLRS